MEASGTVAVEVSGWVNEWVVPLVIAFTIVRCAGLAAREQQRAAVQLDEKEAAALSRTVGGAWLLGVAAGVALMAMTQGLRGLALQSTAVHLPGVVIAGIIGGLAGVTRGSIPRMGRYQRLTGVWRRRIVAAGVMASVAVSVVCLAEYRAEREAQLAQMVAAFYLTMTVGYTATFLEVWR